MHRSVAVSLMFFLALPAVFGNIAMPKQPPAPAGDFLLQGQGFAGLRIDEERLLLDLSGRPGALSRALYRISHPGESPLRTDLYFITPFMQEVIVTLNGKALATTGAALKRDQVPWPMKDEDYGWWSKDRTVEALRFTADFAAGTVTEFEVTFRLPAGYDNTLVNVGIEPAAAGHALNWSKDADHAAWYLYSLESAATFPGGMGVFKLEILAPAGAELNANLTLVDRKTEGDLVRYSGSFQGFPVPSLEAKVITRGFYNSFGGEFAIGLATDYEAYTEFMTQVLGNVYFGNHQFSAGLEANPFGSAANLRLPLLYTFVFGRKTHPYGAFFGDVRATAGALIEVLPDTAVGIRIGLGLRFTLMIFEIDYDFYPFDPERGFAGRMTFLYKMSI
jgi:hypothetical protein